MRPNALRRLSSLFFNMNGLYYYFSKIRRAGLALILVGNLLSGCSASRLPIASDTIPPPRSVTVEEEQYGHQILNELSEQYQVDYSDPRLDQVKRVVDKLTNAAGAKADPWHIYLFKDSKMKNAAATRGNHVFIWTGMLDSVQNDDELAAILGHEIAHVLAGHTEPDPDEEIKKMLIQIGAMAAGIAVSSATRNPMISGSLGDLTSSATEAIGNGMFVNPFAKSLEFEADQIGLTLMAEAGYDPNRAIDFWTRVQGNPDFTSGISFLSTHPSSEDRLVRLRELLPAALQRYSRATGKAVAPDPIPAVHPVPPPSPSKSAATSWPSPAAPSISAHKNTTGAPRSGDSFDVRGNSPPLQSPTPSSNLERWRVLPPRAILYKSPQTSSKKLGEFNADALIEAAQAKKGWLEVFSPDHGYVRSGDVEPDAPIAGR